MVKLSKLFKEIVFSLKIILDSAMYSLALFLIISFTIFNFDYALAFSEIGKAENDKIIEFIRGLFAFTLLFFLAFKTIARLKCSNKIGKIGKLPKKESTK